MMEFQEFLLVLEGFGRKPGGNHRKIIILHKIFDFLMIFLMFFFNFFDGFQGFWQSSSFQVLQNAANTYVETRNQKKT